MKLRQNKIIKGIMPILCFLFLLIFSECLGIPESRLRWYINIYEYKDNNEEYILSETYDGDMVIAGNRLIMVRRPLMMCVDKTTGEVLWTKMGPYNRDFQETPIVIGNKIYNITVTESPESFLALVVLDLDGNAPAGYTPAIYENYSCNIRPGPVVKDNKIYIQLIRKTPASYIIAVIDINTYQIEDFANPDAMLLGRLNIKDNYLYVPYSAKNPGNHAGIYCYDITTKEIVWETQFPDQRDIGHHNPILYKDKLYVGADQTIHIVNADTGEIVKSLYGQGSRGMAIGDNILFIPDCLMAYDLETYNLIWDLQEDATFSGAVFHNGVFYLMAYGFIALDSKTGEYLYPHGDGSDKLWDNDDTFHMPIADDDTIYINGLYGVYAFKPINYPK